MIEYKNPYKCPKCQKTGRWRSGGPEFENEMICFRCWETWTPSEVDEENRENAEKMKNIYGDGI